MTSNEILRAIYNNMHDSNDKIKGKWEIKLQININGLRCIQSILYPTRVRKIGEDLWFDLQDEYNNIILRPQYSYKVLTDNVFDTPRYQVLMDDSSTLVLEKM